MVSESKNNSPKGNTQKVRLFLSAPRDVDSERLKAHEIIKQVNLLIGDRLGCVLETIEWKTHGVPEMGDPEEIINSQIAAYDYDIFLGILWKQFETIAHVPGTGAEEEFNQAYQRWQTSGRPRILLYFSKQPYFPTLDEMDQWRKVQELEKRIQDERKGLVCTYRTPDEFADMLRQHLSKILQEWFPSKGESPQIADFSCYLRYLKADTMYIDIRGLVAGEGKAHQFLIDQLYIPLKTTDEGLLSDKSRRRKAHEPIEGKMPHEILPHEVLLQDVLQEPELTKLIIKGDPGAGKTTFLRLIAYTLCLKWLGEVTAAGSAKIIWPESPPLPIFIRLGKLAGHISQWKEKDSSMRKTREDSLTWLFHYLEEQNNECQWKLTGEIFRTELEAGRCLILLDGLDEAPDQSTREKVSAMAEQLLKTYPHCRVVLTSRPKALTGSVVPPGFHIVQIAPLDEQAMVTFLSEWSKALYKEAPEKSRTHKQELIAALQARPEIRRMARTPVMLTALAVVHWNESRLPEQRAELYESIITWLLRAREQKPGRIKIDQCRKLLQILALAMFTAPQGRLRQIGVARAGETLADDFIPEVEKRFISNNEDNNKGDNKSRTKIKKMAIEEAQIFLEQEMMDSGIIVKRGNELEFWHLSFQEYLAAYEIGGLLDNERLILLFDKDHIYSSEWRELVLLLGGVLYKQGKEKINHLIDAIIGKCNKTVTHDTLSQLSREVGLLGGIVQDLSPFDFKPKNSRYQEVVQSVMGIFDKSTYRNIPVQIRIEAADALGRVGDPRLTNDPMVYISGGIFWMGAQKEDAKQPNYDPEASPWSKQGIHESPVHQVEVSAFFISKYPITVGQYQRFIEDEGYEEKRYWKEGGFGKFQKPDKWEEQQQYPSRPVVKISWYEASAYAHWAGGRLATEAEWERTARGPDQEYRKYPWGNKEPDKDTANYSGSKVGHVTSVGIFPDDCSPEGVIDMGGNVVEWCRDAFSGTYYQECAEKGIVKDPCGPKEVNTRKEGDARVVRGGAYGLLPFNMRCANRDRNIPDLRLVNLGFRVVRAAQP